MKIVITLVVASTLVTVAAAMLARRRAMRAALTPSEATMRDLVREVYADKIIGERVEKSGGDAVLVVELQNDKLKELKVNLSSLARKHEQDGLSLPVIKAGLRFD